MCNSYYTKNSVRAQGIEMNQVTQLKLSSWDDIKRLPSHSTILMDCKSHTDPKLLRWRTCPGSHSWPHTWYSLFSTKNPTTPQLYISFLPFILSLTAKAFGQTSHRSDLDLGKWPLISECLFLSVSGLWFIIMLQKQNQTKHFRGLCSKKILNLVAWKSRFSKLASKF